MINQAVENKPLVSVIMPAYNHDRFVEEAVRSVWEQKYSQVELVVINDGSGDNTGNILDGLINISPIPMKIIHKNNEGLCATLNKGLEIVRGELVAILASDDVMEGDKLNREVKALLGADQIVAGCYGDMYKIDDEGRQLELISYKPRTGDNQFMEYISSNLKLSIQNCTFRTKVLKDIGGFDERLKYEDYDLILRILRQYELKYIGGVSVFYRSVPTGLSKSVYKFNSDRLLILEKHRDAEPVKALGKNGFRIIKSQSAYRAGVHALLNYDRVYAIANFLRSIAAYPSAKRSWLGLVAAIMPVKLVRKVLRSSISNQNVTGA